MGRGIVIQRSMLSAEEEEEEGTALADAMMKSLDHVICACDMGVLST